MSNSTRRVVSTLGAAACLVAAAAAASGLDDAALGERVYSGVLEAPVQLRGGEFEGAPFEPGGAARERVRLAPNGTVRGDLDTWFATKCIFGVLDEAATNWVLSTKNYRLHHELPRILDFIMNGVKM